MLVAELECSIRKIDCHINALWQASVIKVPTLEESMSDRVMHLISSLKMHTYYRRLEIKGMVCSVDTVTTPSDKRLYCKIANCYYAVRAVFSQEESVRKTLTTLANFGLQIVMRILYMLHSPVISWDMDKCSSAACEESMRLSSI